jgi:hypothetical protein
MATINGPAVPNFCLKPSACIIANVQAKIYIHKKNRLSGNWGGLRKSTLHIAVKNSRIEVKKPVLYYANMNRMLSEH